RGHLRHRRGDRRVDLLPAHRGAVVAVVAVPPRPAGAGGDPHPADPRPRPGRVGGARAGRQLLVLRARGPRLAAGTCVAPRQRRSTSRLWATRPIGPLGSWSTAEPIPTPSAPTVVSATTPNHGPLGTSCRCTVSSVLRKLNRTGSSRAPTPLVTSAIITTASSGEVSSPATSGWSSRTQAADGPPSGPPPKGRVTRQDRALTNPTGSQASGSAWSIAPDAVPPGTSSDRSAGRNRKGTRLNSSHV